MNTDMFDTQNETYVQTVYSISIKGFYEEENSPFIDREQETAKALRFLNPEVNPSGVVIIGQGGVGKTRLAFETAKILLNQMDYDEVISITAKNSAWSVTEGQEITTNRRGKYLYASYNGMIKELALFLQTKTRIRQPKTRAILEYLKDKRFLFIIDNLDSINVKPGKRKEEYYQFQEFILTLPKGNKAIITTRLLPEDWNDEGMVLVRLKGLDSNYAYQQFVSLYPDLPSGVSDQAIMQVLKLTNGNPLIMRQFVSVIHDYGINAAIKKFSDIREHDLLSYIYKSTFDQLSKAAQVVAAVVSLATDSVDNSFISRVTGFDTNTIDQIIQELNRASLLVMEDGNMYTVHYLFEEFLINYAPSLWQGWKNTVENVEMD